MFREMAKPDYTVTELYNVLELNKEAYMYRLNINGKEITTEEDQKLLRFLRDDLHLNAAKDGCSEGVCGTCTILVDGKKVKACVQPLSAFEGKKIIITEAYSDGSSSSNSYPLKQLQ